MHFEDIVFIGERIADLGLGNAAIGGSEELIPKYDKTTQEGIKRLQRLIRRESTRALPYTQDINISEKQFEDIIIELKDKALAKGLNGKEFFDEDGDDTYYKFFKKTITDRFPPPAPVPVPTMPVPNTAPVPPAMPAQLPLFPPVNVPGPTESTTSQSTITAADNSKFIQNIIESALKQKDKKLTTAQVTKLKKEVDTAVAEHIQKNYQDKWFNNYHKYDEYIFKENGIYDEPYTRYKNMAEIVKEVFPEYDRFAGVRDISFNLFRKFGDGIESLRNAIEEIFDVSRIPIVLLKRKVLSKYDDYNKVLFFQQPDIDQGNYHKYDDTSNANRPRIYYVNSDQGREAMNAFVLKHRQNRVDIYRNFMFRIKNEPGFKDVMVGQKYTYNYKSREHAFVRNRSIKDLNENVANFEDKTNKAFRLV